MREPRERRSESDVEPWRIIAERKIDELIEAGEFDNLPGKGKPLDLEENPFVAPDMRMPYKILSNSGFSPPWMMLGQEIDNERARWTRFAERQRRRHALASASLERLSGSARARSASQLEAENRRAIEAYVDGLRKLNRLIDRYNLGVPTPNLQRLRVPADALASELSRDLGLGE